MSAIKVVVATTAKPFCPDEETRIADSLARELTRRKLRVDTVRMPFVFDRHAIAQQVFAMRCLDLSEASGDKIDLMIALRFPSYALPHPNTVVWFQEHYRDDEHYPPDEITESEAEIRAIDQQYLGSAAKVFACSRLGAARLQAVNQITVRDVLLPPLDEPERFTGGEAGDYFLCPGPMTSRQIVAIHAMRHTRSNFRLVITIPPGEQEDTRALQAHIQHHYLEGRVELRPESERAQLTNGAFATLALTENHFFYGYAALEAFHAQKPVITCSDSGAIHELVTDGETGLVAEPTPEQIGEAMERLWADRGRARTMGKQGYDKLNRLSISWDRVIAGLTK